MIASEQRQYAERRCRDKARQTNSHATHIDGMEAIHVLTIVDGLDDLLLVNVLRQGQLHDEPVNITVAVQAVHTR